MANFLGNFVSLMGVPVFYFQNLVTLPLCHHGMVPMHRDILPFHLLILSCVM
jgi:hypothetical protein